MLRLVASPAGSESLSSGGVQDAGSVPRMGLASSAWSVDLLIPAK